MKLPFHTDHVSETFNGLLEAVEKAAVPALPQSAQAAGAEQKSGAASADAARTSRR